MTANQFYAMSRMTANADAIQVERAAKIEAARQTVPGAVIVVKDWTDDHILEVARRCIETNHSTAPGWKLILEVRNLSL